MRCSIVKNRLTRKTICVIAIIIIGVLACISLLPVSFDAWLYGNVFTTTISELYAFRLGEIFVSHHPEYQQGESYNYNNFTPQRTDLSNNMEWHGSIIRTKANIMFHNSQYKVVFQGRRFWINKYIWKVEDIYRE